MEQNRIKHILAVAEKMRESAERFGVDLNDAYLVGYLHDIGYEIGPLMHNFSGGMILEKNGFRYWEEIYWHGVPNSNYHSNMLDLLNYSDMTTDFDGTNVTIDERLDHISSRYGSDSSQYINACKLAEELDYLTIGLVAKTL